MSAGDRFDPDAAVRRMVGHSHVRVQKPKDRTPAPVQITAEQLLREAMERQEAEPKPPRQRIHDAEELREVQTRKRKEFEDVIRRQSYNINLWMKYATWEEMQHEIDRARSVFERALDADYKAVALWLKYIEMEQKHKFINHARNLFDRAVALLPRQDVLWYKYVYMEEQLNNFAGARAAFERWMQWAPPETAWNAFVKFELRHNEIERARVVFERFVAAHPTPKIWIKFAKFEERNQQLARARALYEQALQTVAAHEDSSTATAAAEDSALSSKKDSQRVGAEQLYIAFALFEERVNEIERARAIYRYALDRIPKHMAQELYKTFIAFEKTHGDRSAIEDVIVGKRRFQYEEELKQNPKNYDVWFDYIRLEEAYGDKEKIREVYERSIAQVPPLAEKRFWRRYIYLWINYALYEECDAHDIDRAREVYREATKLVPHREFSFSKLWTLYASFEIRQKQLGNARAVLGHALGVAPKAKIFQTYIDLEHKLGNIDRVRTLYAKWIERRPFEVQIWCRFAQLEASLAEIERARALFEVAIAQLDLDMPEVLWKAYIDFECDMGEFDRVRELYRRLLQRTKHVKVWISQAQFEASISNEDAARRIYDEAYQYLRSAPQKEERVMLVENWLEWERQLMQRREAELAAAAKEAGKEETEALAADAAQYDRVEKLLPKRIKRKRVVKAEDGTDAGWEEYFDYTFPDELPQQPQLAILQVAQLWKRQKMLQEEQLQLQQQPAEGEIDVPQPQPSAEPQPPQQQQQQQQNEDEIAVVADEGEVAQH